MLESEAHVPQRWLSTKIVAGISAAALLGACSSEQYPTPGTYKLRFPAATVIYSVPVHGTDCDRLTKPYVTEENPTLQFGPRDTGLHFVVARYNDLPHDPNSPCLHPADRGPTDTLVYLDLDNASEAK